MINPPPERDDEKCHAKISFGDDFGDNRCTFYCRLPKGHDGAHSEEGELPFLWGDKKGEDL